MRGSRRKCGSKGTLLRREEPPIYLGNHPAVTTLKHMGRPSALRKTFSASACEFNERYFRAFPPIHYRSIKTTLFGDFGLWKRGRRRTRMLPATGASGCCLTCRSAGCSRRVAQCHHAIAIGRNLVCGRSQGIAQCRPSYKVRRSLRVEVAWVHPTSHKTATGAVLVEVRLRRARFIPYCGRAGTKGQAAEHHSIFRGEPHSPSLPFTPS
jgi:hypothetical protein